MRHREFVSRRKGARLAPVPLVLFALCAALMPTSRAQDGRPRRVSAAPRTAVTAQQQQTATQTQQQTTAPAQTTARPAQTPTPQQTPQTTGGRPKLQTQPSAQPDQPSAPGDQNQEVNPDEVVRIESNEIKLHVRVVDRNNRPVNDVRQDEVKVFENGVPQTITSFTSEEVPVTYGLVVDNSGSLRSQINQVIEAGKTIVASNKPGDETFVVRFISSDEIKIMQDYTADKQSLDDALDDMFVEGGQTAVIDAVYLSAEHAAERRRGEADQDKRRRALILVTDGEDRASFYKQEQLFEALKEEDVQIFVIGFVNELDRERGFIKKSKRQQAMDLLDKMAKETGGRAFYPASLAELPQIAQDITKDLRTQYVISYVPTT